MTYGQKDKILSLKKAQSVFSILLIISSLLVSSLCSSKISDYVKHGLFISANSIIPSVFPFMLIADFISNYGRFENIKFIKKGFEKIFKINGYGASAFIIGAICGFPLGAKRAMELYRQKVLTKSECERLIGFCNNTGPSFLICGIGYLMRGSMSDGLILYLTMMLSSVIIGVVFSKTYHIVEVAEYYPEKSFSFTSSINSAVTNTLNICGFVTFFSIVTSFIKDIIGNNIFCCFLISFLEVGNASLTFATSDILTPDISLVFTAFATSFSGLSVHLQSKSFIKDSGISMKKYYIMKFSQGILSALLCCMIILLKTLF